MTFDWINRLKRGRAMILAFYGMAAAMIAGGITAMVRGSGFVVMEWGWSMVLAGAFIATGGVITGALTEAVRLLRRIEILLTPPDIDVPNIERESAGFSSWNDSGLKTVPEPSSTPETSTLANIAAAGAAAIRTALAQEARKDLSQPMVQPKEEKTSPVIPAGSVNRQEPALPIPEQNSAELGSLAIPTKPHLFEPLPLPPLGQENVQENVQESLENKLQHDTLQILPPVQKTIISTLPINTDIEDAIFVEAPEEENITPVVADEDGLFDLNPLPESAEEQDKAESALTESASSIPPSRSSIGSYRSGENTFTMYSDGSIEALTPQGTYTFASMQELKAFFDKGISLSGTAA
jgi:hypothetical protein